MKTIGVTGSIASGKTEIARWFGHWGASVIDADRIGHEILRPENPAYHRLIHAFGLIILHPNGWIDRQRLGQLVFADPAKLKILNEIVHPPLVNTLENRLSKIKRSPYKAAVVVAALISEWVIESRFDFILAVTATRRERLRRLYLRGYRHREACQRLSSQLPEWEKKKRADLIIDNRGTLKAMRMKARDIWNLIMEDP